MTDSQKGILTQEGYLLSVRKASLTGEGCDPSICGGSLRREASDLSRSLDHHYQ